MLLRRNPTAVSLRTHSSRTGTVVAALARNLFNVACVCGRTSTLTPRLYVARLNRGGSSKFAECFDDALLEKIISKLDQQFDLKSIQKHAHLSDRFWMKTFSACHPPNNIE